MNTGWGRSLRLSFCLHPCMLQRDRSQGAICLIGPFCLLCCDRASVIWSHIVQDTRSPTLSTLRVERNPEWKSGPALVLKETAILLKGFCNNSSNEMNSASSVLTLPLCLTAQWKFYRVWTYMVITLLAVKDVFGSVAMMSSTSLLSIVYRLDSKIANKSDFVLFIYCHVSAKL